MQVSYDANHNLQIDIDPHNPMQNMFGHSMDVVFNTMTGRDTNYHSAAMPRVIRRLPFRFYWLKSKPSWYWVADPLLSRLPGETRKHIDQVVSRVRFEPR